MAGIDGMRYLGADPTRPADAAERIASRMLLRRMVKELKHGG